jgi:hypothetical protein
MGKAVTITINVEPALECEFRRVAASLYGKRKGALGKAVSAALSDWVASRKKTSPQLYALNVLENGGFHLGNLRYLNRSEIHERG